MVLMRNRIVGFEGRIIWKNVRSGPDRVSLNHWDLDPKHSFIV
jgi:hypothetical protein